MIAEEAYVLSKSFTKKSLDGQGALKGAPCTIKSITEVDGGQKVTFEWTGTSGTKQTSTMIVKNGVSVTGISDKGNGKFTLLLSDGSESDPIQCVKGEDGFSPTATVEKVGKVATITITDKNGTTTATIKDGEGSEGGEANAIDSISVNGVNVVPDENKNVDITVPSIEGLTKDADLATVAKSGNYEDLSNKPAIPSVEGLAKTTDIPTKVSELTDSADYAKTADVNDSISALQTGKADASDLTAHTDDTDIHVTAENKATWNTVSDKVDKEDGKGLSANDYTNEEKALVGTIEDKINKTSIATALDDTVTDEQVASALLAKTELDKKIDKTSIATELSDASTDDEVVGALTAYNELQKLESANKEQFATASGDYITVTDSVDGNIVELSVKGNSFQQTYSGKNLLVYPYTDTTNVNSGVTFTDNDDGSITINGTNTTDKWLYFWLFSSTESDESKRENLYGKQLIISGLKNAVGSIKLESYYKTTDGKEYWVKPTGDDDDYFTITYPSKSEVALMNLAIVIYPNGVVNNVTVKPMIRLATETDSTYEPYVGGIPSPNPSYPQEIKSVVNPVVRVCGKNIINGKHETHGTHNAISFEIDKVVIKDNTETYGGTFAQHTLKKGTYTISCECNYIDRIEIEIDRIAKPVVNKASNSYTFTIDKDSSAKFIVVVYANVTDGVDYIQLEKGSVATPYEPYHEQTVTLPYTLNAIPVSSGGNVTIDGQQYIADYVDFEKKQLVRRVKKKDLGEFDWNYVYNVNPKLKYFDTTILDSFKPTASHPIGEGFCDSYSVEKNNIPQSDLANNKVAIGWLNLSSTRCCLEIRDDNYTNALDFKNAVKGRYIYYPLATQETIDLTDEEVHAFRELATYYPTTNVFVTSEQLNGYAECKYPTTDVSGIASRNESRIADIDKNKVDKSSVVTTLGLSSTDTQVPSAKAVWNKSKNKIQRLLDGVDIIVYADSISNEMATDTVRILNATNSPYGVDNVNNDFHYTIYNVNDDKYKRILAYDIRKNDMYMIVKNNNIWGTWAKLATMDKLGGLTFSASGTTLSITDGTNTWTLEANS